MYVYKQEADIVGRRRRYGTVRFVRVQYVRGRFVRVQYVRVRFVRNFACLGGRATARPYASPGIPTNPRVFTGYKQNNVGTRRGASTGSPRASTETFKRVHTKKASAMLAEASLKAAITYSPAFAVPSA